MMLLELCWISLLKQRALQCRNEKLWFFSTLFSICTVFVSIPIHLRRKYILPPYGQCQHVLLLRKQSPQASKKLDEDLISTQTTACRSTYITAREPASILCLVIFLVRHRVCIHITDIGKVSEVSVIRIGRIAMVTPLTKFVLNQFLTPFNCFLL